jgi:hypothetical protein
MFSPPLSFDPCFLRPVISRVKPTTQHLGMRHLALGICSGAIAGGGSGHRRSADEQRTVVSTWIILKINDALSGSAPEWQLWGPRTRVPLRTRDSIGMGLSWWPSCARKVWPGVFHRAERTPKALSQVQRESCLLPDKMVTGAGYAVRNCIAPKVYKRWPGWVASQPGRATGANSFEKSGKSGSVFSGAISRVGRSRKCTR